MSMSVNLVNQMFSGDRLALSRLISLVEARSKDLVSIMSRVQEKCGHTYCVGITGPPGAGKSTIVDRLITHLRKNGDKVGVLAIDPSSPFSGGAVLGDRIRMQEHASDEDVFIRSLGSRGSHGGLSRATREVVKLYDAFGMDDVLVETVGVGQTELDIMEIADTTVVILTPESGDAIQTMKAGILEIADIFVVNKADRDGAHLMQAELKAMVEISGKKSNWEVPVLLVQANKDEGIAELLKSLKDHRYFLRSSGQNLDMKKKLAVEEIKEILLDEIRSRLPDLMSQCCHSEQSEESHEMTNPYQEAQKLLKKLETLWARSKPSTRRPVRSSQKSKRPVKKKSKRR